jgi:hypothetical protein
VRQRILETAQRVRTSAAMTCAIVVTSSLWISADDFEPDWQPLR